MKPAAALFDFDGTLVDTEGPDCALISRMLLEVGIRKTPNEVMKDFIGLPRTEIEEAILAHYGVQVPLDWHPRYIEERSKLEDHMIVTPGIEDALRRLQNSGVQLGVASNSYEPRLKRVLAKSGLETWFGDRLFHLDQGSRRKPAPDIFLPFGPLASVLRKRLRLRILHWVSRRPSRQVSAALDLRDITMWERQSIRSFYRLGLSCLSRIWGRWRTSF